MGLFYFQREDDKRSVTRRAAASIDIYAANVVLENLIQSSSFSLIVADLYFLFCFVLLGFSWLLLDSLQSPRVLHRQ